MRCPDCNADVVLKPEVVVQKEPCECGLTADVRLARTVVFGIVSLLLVLLAGCWMSNYYTTKAIELDPRVVKPSPVPWPTPMVVEPEEK